MPNVLEWFLIGLAMLLGVIGSTETIESAPAGIASPGSVTTPAAAAQALAETTSVLDLLAYVPDTRETREWLILGDVDAWHETTGIERIGSIEETRAMNENAYTAWMHALPNETMPPAALGIQYLAAEDLRDITGFSYFEAQHYLEAGNPPDAIAIVTVHASPAWVANALLASGYEGTRAAGAMLYSLNDDYALDLSNPSRLAALGTLNRIAVLDASPDAASTTVIIGKATAPVEAALSARKEGNALASDPVYAALSGMLRSNASAVPGNLVGLLFLGAMPALDPSILLGATPEEAKAQLEALQTRLDEKPLSPWWVTALATHRDGEDLYLSALVAFPPGTDGEANADTLAERLATYESMVTRRSFAELWEPFQSTALTVEGIPVAWVTMKVHPDAVRSISWLRMLVQRDDLFLVPSWTQ